MKYLRTGKTLTATLTLSVTALCSPVFGQEGSSRTGTLSFSQGLEYSDNVDLTDPSNSGFTSRTGLGLSLQSETRTELLRFTLDSEIVGEFGENLADDFELENTTARAVYNRVGANASLNFSAFYSEFELDENVVQLDIGGASVIDQGTLARFGANSTLVFGREGPFEVTLNSAFRDLDYQDTVNPTLNDETRFSFDGVARARLNPALTVRGLAGYRNTDEDDLINTERDVTFIGLGAETETASGLLIVGDVLFDRSETSTDIGDDTEDGVGADVEITQQRPNGTLGLELSTRIDESGRRSLARATRTLVTQTGGLSFSFGVVDQESSDGLEFLGGFGYTRELPRGTLAANVTQDTNTRDGDAFLNTTASLDYSQIINSISGWQAELEFVSSNELGGDDDDSRATAVLSYTRELTEEWNLRAGVEYIRDIEENAPNTDSSTVFLNIERDITFGF